MNKAEMPILEHLLELRRALVVSALAFVGTSSLVFAFLGQQVWEIAVDPLVRTNLSLVYLGLTEGFLVRLKLCLLAGFFLSLPILLWLAWSFFGPGLKINEKRLFWGITLASLMLFLVGVVFGYLVILPVMIRFLVLAAGSELAPVLSAEKYISFLVCFLAPLGAVFELPLVIYLLTRSGMVTPRQLAKYRYWSIFSAFILGAVITPSTDILGQTLLAGPIILLYEVGILVARLAERRRIRQAAPSPSKGS